MAEVKEQEPSIEEILESIRQIISDDGDGTTKVEPLAKAVEVVPPKVETPVPVSLTPEKTAADASNLDLSSQQAAPEPETVLKAPPPQASMPADDDILDLVDKVGVDPEPEAEVSLEMLDQPIMDTPMASDDNADNSNLMSSATASAATEALSKLLAGNVAIEREMPGRPGNVTLEDMTRELMKPMLKSWLDQNLPGIIEKVVQREVEKIARRALDR